VIKNFFCIILVSFLIFIMIGCNLTEFENDEIIEAFSQVNEDFIDTKESFFANALVQMANASVDSTIEDLFETDYMIMNTVQASEILYYLIISLYNANLLDVTQYTSLPNLAITKSGSTYFLSFTGELSEEVVVEVTAKQNSSKIVERRNDIVTYGSETLKLGPSEYAQLFYHKQGESYDMGELYVNGNVGRFSIEIKLQSISLTIYDNPAFIKSLYATEGDRLYIVDVNDFTYTNYLKSKLISFLDQYKLVEANLFENIEAVASDAEHFNGDNFKASFQLTEYETVLEVIRCYDEKETFEANGCTVNISKNSNTYRVTITDGTQTIIHWVRVNSSGISICTDYADCTKLIEIIKVENVYAVLVNIQYAYHFEISKLVIIGPGARMGYSEMAPFPAVRLYGMPFVVDEYCNDSSEFSSYYYTYIEGILNETVLND